MSRALRQAGMQSMSWHPATATQVARVGRSTGREAYHLKEQSHVE